MVGLRDMKERGYIPTKQFVQMVIRGTFSLAKILATRAGALKNVNQALPREEQYVRPPRRYLLPEYRPGMDCCAVDEKYLRPTLFCDPHAPEVVALAHQLGAFSKSDYEFARAAHEFVKRNILLEIMPLDGVASTLRRGTGTCLQINSVFVALCRAAGIKARYKIFSARQSAAMYNDIYDAMVRQWYDALGFFSIEADVEVYVDGTWMLANVGPTPARQAAMGSPITTLGEGSIGNWFEAVPGTVWRSESLPLGIGLLSRLLLFLAPGSVNKLNVNIIRQREKGEVIIAQAGGEERYDARIRAQRSKLPRMELAKEINVHFR